MALGPEDKKKIYLLAGVAGLLGVAGLVLLRPSGDATADSTTNTSTPLASSTGIPGGSGSVPDAPPSGAAGALPIAGSSAPMGGAPMASGSTAGASSAKVMAVSKFRDDPFQQYYTKVPPLPTPVPPPPPIPPPLDIPEPQTATDPDGGIYQLPGGPGGSSVASQALVGLPSARIPRLVNVPTAPRVQVAPPSQSGGGQPALERSGNKRLAGVVIGDSVRALLEVEDLSAASGGGSSGSSGSGYPGGEGGAAINPPKTYIVQPGQEIPEENIKVLRIERTNENGQTRVRMIVIENGVTRYIELREGNRAAVSGGEGGSSGSSGSGSSSGSRGYPGSGGRPPFVPN